MSYPEVLDTEANQKYLGALHEYKKRMAKIAADRLIGPYESLNVIAVLFVLLQLCRPLYNCHFQGFASFLATIKLPLEAAPGA